MEFKMVCSTWVKEDDEKVLNALRQSDRMLTIEELSEITGLPIFRVHRTLRLLNQQIRMAEQRKQFNKKFLD